MLFPTVFCYQLWLQVCTSERFRPWLFMLFFYCRQFTEVQNGPSTSGLLPHKSVYSTAIYSSFFCQMDDRIGVTVPGNFCKSAIDSTRLSGCCLARACLHKEYANTCLLLKDSPRWDVKNRILLCLRFSSLLWLKRDEVSIFSWKLHCDNWHSRTSNKCSDVVIVILLTTNYLSNTGENQTKSQS